MLLYNTSPVSNSCMVLFSFTFKVLLSTLTLAIRPSVAELAPITTFPLTNPDAFATVKIKS